MFDQFTPNDFPEPTYVCPKCGESYQFLIPSECRKCSEPTPKLPNTVPFDTERYKAFVQRVNEVGISQASEEVMRESTKKDLLLTIEEAEAIVGIIDGLSGGNPENVFANDGTDTMEDVTTRTFAKLYMAVGKGYLLPNNLRAVDGQVADSTEDSGKR